MSGFVWDDVGEMGVTQERQPEGDELVKVCVWECCASSLLTIANYQ